MNTLTTDTPLDTARELAAQYRVRSIQMAAQAGSGHPTSSMSAADLMAVLVLRHLRIDPARPDHEGNDRLLFSKGHASPLLYAMWDSMHLLESDLDGVGVVDAYRRPGSILEGHPTPRVPGVPAATGSLGLGLAIGVGLASGNHLSGMDEAHVWILCGDGELAEGAVWEAAEHAGSTPVVGLTAIVDVNRLGQTGETRHGWDLDAYRRRFEAFGWRAVDVDGHDLEEIDAALAAARTSDRPTAVIAQTIKGRGASETADATGKHGQPLDDPDRAIAELGGDRELDVRPARPTALSPLRPAPTSEIVLPRWELGEELATRDAFGEALLAAGRATPRLIALDGEVKNSTRVAAFAEEFPKRFVEAYIAEQLMTGIAIGLDACGWHPVVTTFGSFLTRAHDVLRMASIGHASITVAGTHAGVSIGEDGPSQMALEDLAMMRAISGSTVLSPCDANQTAALVRAMADVDGIGYLRLMRGPTPVIHPPDVEFAIGGSAMVRAVPDPDVVIVATGVTVHEALEASDRLAATGITAGVLDTYSIKPIDDEAIASVAGCGRLVVVEDHHYEGGLGEATCSSLARTGSTAVVAHLAVGGIPESASPAEQRSWWSIDAEAIAAEATRLVDAA